MLTIREFIVKIQKECPNADIEILPQSCTEGNIKYEFNDKNYFLKLHTYFQILYSYI